MRVAAALAVLVAAVPAAAADEARSLQGSGRLTTEAREVPPFEGVRLETTADVAVRVGPARSVRVRIDENLQPLLSTRVRDGVLLVEAEDRLRPTERPRIEIEVPALRRLSLEGQGEVSIHGGAGELSLTVAGSGDLSWRGEATTLRVRLEGSGDVALAGRADALLVAIEGSGDVEASHLVAHDVTASVEGSGDVEVTMDGGALVASVSGSGDVHWRGEASVQRAAVSGSGEISRRE